MKLSNAREEAANSAALKYPAITDLIPHRPPFLFIDEIVSAGPDSLVARRTWRAEEDFYKGHYPDGPITPGVILCECVIQAGALLVALTESASGGKPKMPILARIRDVRFRLPVFPGDTTTIEVKQKEFVAGFGLMSGTMKCGEKRVLSIDFSVASRDAASILPTPPT